MIILYLLFGYLLVNVSYYAFFAFFGVLKSVQETPRSSISPKRIAVFIPAYREDSIIVDTARKALLQRYPVKQQDVFIIADSLKAETIRALKRMSVKVMEVSFEQSTKAKAINEAFARIQSHYDIAVILDADNVMAKDFLHRINAAYCMGNMAIQGHRTAKNNNNHMAIMDGVSEEINNHIFRKGHQNAGLSSALIGSGMAFDYNLLKNYMSEINAIGGFDKALELALLKDGVKIKYLEDAFIYDEKVANDQTFTRQRTRWIAAQIRYGMSSFKDALKHLIKEGNVDYFDKSLQFLLLPRLMLLGALSLAIPVGILTAGWTGAVWTLSAALLLALTLLSSLPASYRTETVLNAATKLPRTFWLMITAIFGYKKAKDNFLHTPHHTLS